MGWKRSATTRSEPFRGIILVFLRDLGNPRKPSAEIVGVSAEIRTKNLVNIGLDRYHYSILLGIKAPLCAA
jgi:hypothetical protein